MQSSVWRIILTLKLEGIAPWFSGSQYCCWDAQSRNSQPLGNFWSCLSFLFILFWNFTVIYLFFFFLIHLFIRDGPFNPETLWGWCNLDRFLKKIKICYVSGGSEERVEVTVMSCEECALCSFASPSPSKGPDVSKVFASQVLWAEEFCGGSRTFVDI